MSKRTHTNITGKTGGGNIFYDKRFDLLYKMAKEQDISKEAQRRLKWMDHHVKCKNAALTSRYFGISESCFWKWKKCFDDKGLPGLESKSRRPHKLREPETHPDTVEEISRLRKLFPCYGKEKIHALMGKPPDISVSTIGRIIKRYHLFFRKRKRKHYHSWRWGKKQRIKDLILRGEPGEHIQMDTIILYRYGKIFYIKTAIDTVTKITFAYVYKKNSSVTSVDFLHKLQSLLPYAINNIHTDNGSEFMGDFERELRKQGIKHYFSYPHCPKQHGAIERFNRTLQEEFLSHGNFWVEIPMLNQKLITWLIEYNFHRPHSALGYENPLAFYDKNFSIKVEGRPSTMYWTYTYSGLILRSTL